MKKLLSLLSFLVLLTAFTCDNEPLEGDFFEANELSCEIAAQNTQEAAIAFLDVNDENYTELCTNYTNALQVQIEFCGDPDGILQTQLNSLGNCINDVGPGEGIEGTWLATAWIASEPVDINNDGTASTDLLAEFNDCYNNETIVFNSDNTGVVMSTSYADITFDIVVGTTDEYVYSVDCIQEIDNSDIMWSQNGNQITTTDDFGTELVWTLNGDQLSTVIPEGFIAFNTEDASVTVTQDLTFIYTRQ